MLEIIINNSFIIVILFVIIFTSFTTVQQNTVSVTTIFGKYNRTLRAGINFKIPIFEKVYKRISIQNRSSEMEFQAVTVDQANVYFKTMILYSVIDQEEETIKNVAFKFVDETSFMQALIRTVEGNIRGFVSTKRQSEVLSVRQDIVLDIKSNLDHVLESWGYHLIDIQINDMTFDDTIMKSMAQVVASQNLLAAAENEGKALLITKTKAAEADGNAIKISAEAEKEAARLRGQGVAQFRQEVAKGMAEASKEMQTANMDISVILFTMWTDTIKSMAEQGKGNTIFLDGSTDNMNRTLQQLMATAKGDVFNETKS